ncbi:MAG: F0F1 ATP synthase subunit B [Opitutales bacterium]|nr:F0F1 ATP synthase subunit B [Opitutales bacterium]
MGETAVTRLMGTFGVQSELLIAQILNFCLVAYLLYRFAIKPTLKTVEERQKKIADGLQYAESMKQQLAAAEKERLQILKQAQEEAQALLAKATSEGEQYWQVQKKAADEKVEQIVSQARNAMEVEHRNLLNETKAEVSTLVMETTERLLQKVLTDDLRAKLNQQAVSLLSNEHGTKT